MKTCVLFSGGWDSAAAALLTKDQKPDLLFFNYGQIYYEQEIIAAKKFADNFNLILIQKLLPIGHDAERRNFYFVLEAKKLGYQKIITGNRNIFPWFDKYKDSNWLSLKILAWLMNVKICMPIIAWPKSWIIAYVEALHSSPMYNCYFAKNDFKTCSCVNCKEFKKLKGF